MSATTLIIIFIIILSGIFGATVLMKLGVETGSFKFQETQETLPFKVVRLGHLTFLYILFFSLYAAFFLICLFALKL